MGLLGIMIAGYVRCFRIGNWVYQLHIERWNEYLQAFIGHEAQHLFVDPLLAFFSDFVHEAMPLQGFAWEVLLQKDYSV